MKIHKLTVAVTVIIAILIFELLLYYEGQNDYPGAITGFIILFIALANFPNKPHK